MRGMIPPFFLNPGVLDLGDWGVARTPLCVKKRQLGRLMDRYALAGVDSE
jgi:hypothetical protein